MAKTTQEQVTKPPSPEPQEIALVGLARTPTGYVPVSAVIQGTRVLSQQVHGAPAPKEYAAQILKMLIISKVISPNLKPVNIEGQ